MKTGRLLKFHRPGVEVQAYLYRDAGVCRAAVYLPGHGGAEPIHTVEAATEQAVEAEVRRWVSVQFPDPGEQGDA